MIGPEQSARVRAFLDEVEALQEKHGLEISHEDSHGAFLIEPYGLGTGGLDSARDLTPEGKAAYDRWLAAVAERREQWKKDRP